MTEIETIMKQTADYVAVVQPQLDKSAAAQDVFVKAAQRTIGVLAHRNIIEAGTQDKLLDKLAQDHSYALVMLEKLAGIVGADQMGAPSNITKVSESEADPWVREYLPEMVNKSNTL